MISGVPWSIDEYCFSWNGSSRAQTAAEWKQITEAFCSEPRTPILKAFIFSDGFFWGYVYITYINDDSMEYHFVERDNMPKLYLARNSDHE
jgi:hypothetical protein